MLLCRDRFELQEQAAEAPRAEWRRQSRVRADDAVAGRANVGTEEAVDHFPVGDDGEVVAGLFQILRRMRVIVVAAEREDLEIRGEPRLLVEALHLAEIGETDFAQQLVMPAA